MLAIVASVLPACGDPGDAQVPLPLGGRSPAATPRFEAAGMPAFANLRIEDPDGGGVCPVGFEDSLGSLCDASTPATCARLLDGDAVTARCTVRARSDAAELYDVDLQLQHELLPELGVLGPMGEGGDTRVALRLVAPDGARLDATCRAQAISMRADDAYFRLLDCTNGAGGSATPGCGVSLTARFQYCARE